MERPSRLTVVVALLIAVAALPARAQDPGPGDDPVTLGDGSQLWFVEMAGAPLADGGTLASILAEQSAFRASASQAGVTFTERKAFQNLWNGLSLAVSPRDLVRLGTLGSVAALYPVVAIAPPEGEPVTEPELLTALAMTGADIAQSSLGLTGAGVKVGVIDTGVDYDHPALGGDGVIRTNSAMIPNARVITGWDFVGDAYTGPGAVLNPDPYPDDCNGHGSHVAGIVGAAGGVTGVAPGVTIGAYRVFGCDGSTSADIMIEAMERALDDGMQVINMSIGSERQWPKYPTGAASTRLVNKGVVVCASIGNAGPIGLWGASAPGVGDKVIGVASFQNNFINISAITVSPDDRAVGYNVGGGTPPPPPPPTSGTFSMVRTGTSTSTADACAPLAPGSLTGMVALIRRGTCTFYAKARNAQNAGAIAVVFYNNTTGAFSPGLTPTPAGSPPITIPVVSITQADGNLIDARLALGPVSLTWGASLSTPNPNGGLIATSSSYGPGADLTIKPDLGAPGGFIRSTFPLELGGYANISGTSMASPHVAGAAALLLEARPNTAAQAVRAILQNSARPAPRAAGIEAVQRQGAGMLRIDDAVLATTRVEPGKLELGETELGPVTKTLSIANKGDVGVSYTLGHDDALATGPNTFTPSFLVNSSSVVFGANPVFVPAGATVNVDVTIAPDAALPDRSLFGGFITAIPDDGGVEMRVPFMGFKGDYQSIPVVVPTTATPPFPRLTKLVAGAFVPQPGGATYSLQGNDLPWIEYHFDHPVELHRWEIFDAGTGQAWHRALNGRFVPRNSGAATFFRTGWTGRTAHGQQEVTVPNGQYVLNLSIKKALGHDANPAHWESWTSPPITLARPDLLVTGLAVSQNVVNAGDEVTIYASIRNDSAVDAAGVTVTLADNDVTIHSEAIDLAPQQQLQVEAPWLVSAEAQHRLTVTVSQLDAEIDLNNNWAELRVELGQGIVGVGGTSKVLALAPAMPNPFGDDVAFLFSLPETGPASLEVFDLLGRRVQAWTWSALPAGDHRIAWDGRMESGAHAPAGALIYRLTAMGRTLTRKAVRVP
ncbi:MAG: S8 family serine peptidase [Candidatus Eiseniibacteriota bacterium]